MTVDLPLRDCDELVRTHLPLVGHAVRAALTRLPAATSRGDLVSAGVLGLLLAARSAAEAGGAPFVRAAAARIHAAIADDLRDNDRSSRSAVSRSRADDQARHDVATALRREPSPAQLAQAFGVREDELGHLGASDDSQAAGPAPSPAGSLPERLRLVVDGYYRHQRTTAELAAELEVTPAEVVQLRSRALAELGRGKSSGGTRGDGCAVATVFRTPAGVAAGASVRAAGVRAAFGAPREGLGGDPRFTAAG